MIQTKTLFLSAQSLRKIYTPTGIEPLTASFRVQVLAELQIYRCRAAIGKIDLRSKCLYNLLIH